MKTNRHFLVGLLVMAVAVGVVGLWYAAKYGLDQVTGFDRYLFRQYESVTLGMIREEVVRRMGQPSREVSQFYWPAPGYDEDYLRAEKSGAVYYLYWDSSSGWDPYIYAVGFTTNNVVAFKSRGTSDPPKKKR